MTRIIILLLFLFTNAFAQLTDVQRSELPFKNLITNPEFENGKTGWSVSGGDSFTLVTSTPAKKELGASYITWDSAGASRVFTHSTITVDEANKNTNGLCEFTTEVPSGTATHLIRVYDGTNVLLSSTIVSTTTPYKNSLSFPMPASGTVQCQLVSVASNEPLIRVYKGWLGGNYRLGETSQAEFYGSQAIQGASSCYASGINSSAFNNYSADSDCSTPTLLGYANSTAGKIPGVSFPSLPPGRYRVVAQIINDFSASDMNCSLRISDGTTSGPVTRSAPGGSGGGAQVDRQLEAMFEYATTQGAKIFQVQAANTSGVSGTCDWANQLASDRFEIAVYRFPTSSQTIFTPETYNWILDASISGNISLSTSDVSSLTAPDSSSLTLTNNSGSITSKITCSSTNAPTGTTCSSGNEQAGVNFDIPAPQNVEVCFSFGHEIDINASTQLYGNFSIAETASNSQTVVQNCGPNIIFGRDGAEGARTDQLESRNVCGICKFSSAGNKTVRLMYQLDFVSGTFQAHTIFGTSTGGGSIGVKARPLTQNIPAPVLIGALQAGTNGSSWRQEWGTFFTTSEGSSCTGSPCGLGKNTNGVSSVTRNNTGDYTINFSPAFLSAPNCVFTPIGVNRYVNNYDVGSGSAMRLQTFSGTISSPSAADTSVSFLCMGPK